MKQGVFNTLMLVLFTVTVAVGQKCTGSTNLKHGRGYFQFLESVGHDQLIGGGVYYTTNQPYFAYDGDTLYPHPGDQATVFAVVMDSAFNRIRMFNVIGFSQLGGGFNALRIWDFYADAAGNSYVTGAFPQDTLISGVDTVYSDHYLEGFLVRCDSLGTTTLLKAFGSRNLSANYTYEDRGTCVTADSAGNIFVGGNFSGDYFRINTDTVNNGIYVGLGHAGQGFVFSLDPSGNTRFVKAFGAAAEDDSPYGIAVDELGNVTVCGESTVSNHDFIFGNLKYHFKASQFSYQSFVCRMDSAGTPQWLYPIETYSGNGPDAMAMDVAVGSVNDVYVMGYFDYYAVFNGDTVAPFQNSTSAFLLKLDGNGNKRFVKTGRIDTFYAFLGKVKVAADKVFIVGQSYVNQMSFDQLATCCGNDCYFAMYDTSGVIQWLEGGSTTGASNMYVSDCAIDEHGIAYASGSASGGQVTIAPNSFNATSAGDFYLVRFGDLPSNGLAVSIQNNGSSDTVTCGGYLPLQALVSPSGSTVYNWWADKDTMTAVFPGANLNATPKFDCLYIVMVKRGGCVASDSIFLHVKPVPVNLGADLSVCAGSAVTVSAASYPTASYSWWPLGDLSNDTISAPSLNATTSQTYYCTIAVNGCTNTDTLQVDVTQFPVAGFSYQSTQLTVQFSDTSLNGKSFNWDFGDGTSDSLLTAPIHTYLVADSFRVCLTVSNECGADTLCQTVDLRGVGVTEDEPEAFRVSSGRGIWLVEGFSGAPATWEVLNSFGQRCSQGAVSGSTLSIDHQQLAGGMYVLKIAGNGRQPQCFRLLAD